MAENIYENISTKLKAISDQKRLKIVDMLSCGELCACEILEKFDISQPTLSCDMKKLEEAKLVKSRREGKNIYYSLNQKALGHLLDQLTSVFSDDPDCICHSKERMDY
ncbi:ArsR/SmtB family transcription factor [Ezakiella peruensis]|uniref:ArsR/SmtB family transcription factor n=1 Tax=Ezakiella peruensis TaxID=1464038 RepID=UPI000C1B1EAA|nr:metalloregulator ArsR/SmtB family transcription factor [Ezakiella peruensis]